MNRRHASASPPRPQPYHESTFEGPCIDYIAQVCTAKAPSETNTQLCVLGLGMNLEGVAAALLRRSAATRDGTGRIFCVVVPDGTPCGSIARIAGALRWYVQDESSTNTQRALTKTGNRMRRTAAGSDGDSSEDEAEARMHRHEADETHHPDSSMLSRCTMQTVNSKEQTRRARQVRSATKSESGSRRKQNAKRGARHTNYCDEHDDAEHNYAHTTRACNLAVHTIDEGTSTKTRCAAFMQGGVVVSSSRTLCADMLHQRLCVDLVATVILLFPYSTLGANPRDTLTPSLAFCTEMLLRDAAARAARYRRAQIYTSTSTLPASSSRPGTTQSVLQNEKARDSPDPSHDGTLQETTTMTMSRTRKTASHTPVAALSDSVPASLRVVILSDHSCLMQYLVQRHQTGTERFTHQMHIGDIQLFPRFRLELVTHFERMNTQASTTRAAAAAATRNSNRHSSTRTQPLLQIDRTMHRVSVSTQALDHLLHEMVVEVLGELHRLDERLQRAADDGRRWSTSSSMLGASPSSSAVLPGAKREETADALAANVRQRVGRYGGSYGVAEMDEEARHLAPRSAGANAANMDRLGSTVIDTRASSYNSHNTQNGEGSSKGNSSGSLRYVYRPWRDRANPRNIKFGSLDRDACTDVDFGDLDADLHAALRANEPDWTFRGLVESMIDVRHLRRALRAGSSFDFLFALQSVLQQRIAPSDSNGGGRRESSYSCCSPLSSDATSRPPSALWTLSAHFSDLVSVATQRIGKLTTIPAVALPAATESAAVAPPLRRPHAPSHRTGKGVHVAQDVVREECAHTETLDSGGRDMVSRAVDCAGRAANWTNSVIDCDALSSEGDIGDPHDPLCAHDSKHDYNQYGASSSSAATAAAATAVDDEEDEVVIVEGTNADSASGTTGHASHTDCSNDDPIASGGKTTVQPMQTILVPNSEELGEEDKLEIVRRLAHGWCRDARATARQRCSKDAMPSRGVSRNDANSLACHEGEWEQMGERGDSGSCDASSEEEACCTAGTDRNSASADIHPAEKGSPHEKDRSRLSAAAVVPAMLIVTSGWRELRRCVERLIYTRRVYERLQFDNFLRRYRERCGVSVESQRVSEANGGNAPVSTATHANDTAVGGVRPYTAGAKRTRFKTAGLGTISTKAASAPNNPISSENSNHRSVGRGYSGRAARMPHMPDSVNDQIETDALAPVTGSSLQCSGEDIATQLPMWLRRDCADGSRDGDFDDGPIKREVESAAEEEDNLETEDVEGGEGHNQGRRTKRPAPRSSEASSSSSSSSMDKGACRAPSILSTPSAAVAAATLRDSTDEVRDACDPGFLFSQSFAGPLTPASTKRHDTHPRSGGDDASAATQERGRSSHIPADSAVQQATPQPRSLHEILLTQPYFTASAEMGGAETNVTLVRRETVTITDVSDDEEGNDSHNHAAHYDCADNNYSCEANASRCRQDGILAVGAHGAGSEATFQVEQLGENMAVLVLGEDKESLTESSSSSTRSPGHCARVVVIDGSFLCVADVVQMILGTHPSLQFTATTDLHDPQGHHHHHNRPDPQHTGCNCVVQGSSGPLIANQETTAADTGHATSGLVSYHTDTTESATSVIATALSDASCHYAGNAVCAVPCVSVSARIHRIVLTQQSLPLLRMLEMAQDDLTRHVVPRIKVHVMSSVFSDARFDRTVAHEREAFQSLAHTKATLTGTLLVDRAALRRTEEELQSGLLKQGRGRVGVTMNSIRAAARSSLASDGAKGPNSENALMPMQIRRRGTERESIQLGVQHSCDANQRATGCHGTANSQTNRNPLIVFDEREFRSTLPYELYCRGIDLVPLTLTTADYVLSPDFAVERKSVPDYNQSLQSGRIFHQLSALSRRYAQPLCLLEFSRSAPFRLTYTTLWNRSTARGNDGSYSSASSSASMIGRVYGRTARLMAAHPRVCFLWARSPAHSAMMMVSFKRGPAAANVDPSDATLTSHGLDDEMDVCVFGDHARGGLRATVGSAGVSELSHYAARVLSRFPGVTQSNVAGVMQVCGSLAGLATVAKAALQRVMEEQAADQLYAFLHTPFAESVE